MGNRQKNQIKKELLRERKIQMERKEQRETQPSNLTSSLLNYETFFQSSQHKKMVVYNQFPKLSQIIEYYDQRGWNAPHPIFEYGKFEIQELAIIIKYLYSFSRNEEYQTLLFGYLERTKFRLLEGEFEELRPNLYFLIGKQTELEKYQQYQNCFLETEQEFDFQTKQRNFISLRAKEGTISNRLGIDTRLENGMIYPGIHYYDEIRGEYNTVKYLSHINIFDNCFYQKMDNYSGIQDTLSFPIHNEDTFLAKLLISIAMYKKNHDKVNLSNEDYQTIFYTLFQERGIQMSKEISKIFPKQLKLTSKK